MLQSAKLFFMPQERTMMETAEEEGKRLHRHLKKNYSTTDSNLMTTSTLLFFSFIYFTETRVPPIDVQKFAIMCEYGENKQKYFENKLHKTNAAKLQCLLCRKVHLLTQSGKESFLDQVGAHGGPLLLRRKVQDVLYGMHTHYFRW